MILPAVRDPRLVTIRRGGTLTDEDHHALAIWAAECAEHVLPLFEAVRHDDARPREAIAAARAWTRGELPMIRTRAMAAAPGSEEAVRRAECRWQRDRVPATVCELVLEDQQRRNAICWSVFDR